MTQEPSDNVLRILIADDQALLRAAFKTLLETADEMQVVAEAGTGIEAVELAKQLQPDVVLMDIRMPELDGLTATAQISADPALAKCRVLILTTYETDEYVAQGLRNGASGFIGKGIDADGLIDAVRTIASGERLLSPAATRSLVERFLAAPHASADRPEELAELTARETEMVALVATGLSNIEIADRMFLSPFTVRAHVQRAMTKLNARDRAQLVVIAYQSGLVQTSGNS